MKCRWIEYKKMSYFVTCTEVDYALSSLEVMTFIYCPFCGERINWIYVRELEDDE